MYYYECDCSVPPLPDGGRTWREIYSAGAIACVVGAFASDLNQKGACHAVDDFRGTAGFVATGIGEFVHIWRFYSHFAGAGARSPGH